MKKFTFIIAALFIVGGVFAQQLQIESPVLQKMMKKSPVENKSGFRGDGIDNVSFETWHTDYQAYGFGEMPFGYTMITGNVAVQKSTDANAGTYAMRVENGVISNPVLGWTDTLVGGLAISSQGLLFGDPMFQPYTERPTSITFWAKGQLNGNDTALVVFQMTDDGEFVGGTMGMIGPDELTTTYQEFTFAFEYDLPNLPDSAAIIVTSSGVGVFTGFDIGTLTAGSYIIIDNISYEYEVLTEPAASCTPLVWNAGGVDVSSNTTSETFTLTNIGAGTLTVSNVTSLSAPWSTTFSAGAVSLVEDQTYQFTFGFAPTVEGPAAQTFVITTNGGEITISLSGSGNTVIVGNMDGGFENNVNDFDLTFAGWNQIDNDGGVSYGIQDVDFTNAGYTGSFIAFNPTATTPALTEEAWAAYDGARYGACFNAVTASAPNNDWLITPQSTMINAGGDFRAYVKSITDDWGLERYAIWVSTTGIAQGNFTKISTGTFVEAPLEWTLIEYSLDAYVGQQVYVAIQCVSNDAFAFMIDNVIIDNPVSVENNIASTISVFPNPANDVLNVANAENANITIVDMIGNVVATVDNASANQSINISNLANGTYFVRVNGEVFKFNVVK
jgi:hypothetical protein